MAEQHPELDPKFIDKQRQRLEALREDILRGEREDLAEERAYGEEHGDEIAEPEEGAQRMTEFEIEQSLHDVEAPRLRAIERALQKIEDGTYGLSDLSDEPIPKARLEAVPEALFTIEEEEERERELQRRR